jgi:outer membrane immunogenic protein
MRLNMFDRTVGVVVRIILAGICMVISAVVVRAQTPAATAPFGLDPGQIAVMEVGVDYAYFHANAPPGKCGCFSLEGLGGGFAINAEHGFSAVLDLSTANANGINGTTQNIRILNFLGGPRYSFRSRSKFTPYGQVLIGASQEFSTVAFATNQTAFAVSGGAGVNHALGRYFGWKIVEASYLYSQLPNGSNDHQNDLRISTGLFFRMGPR